ncbi:MAG: hypothetical protein INR69_07605 [Mucilaginibacter polytrichastri]|nr:hypothetical protein [Mucilaginibacter polytrichastri]
MANFYLADIVALPGAEAALGEIRDYAGPDVDVLLDEPYHLRFRFVHAFDHDLELLKNVINNQPGLVGKIEQEKKNI